MTEYYIADYKVINTTTDTKGNIYHLAIRRSLLLSIVCEIGIQETLYNDKYYLNMIAVYKNTNMQSPVGSKDFSFQTFDNNFIMKIATEILSKGFEKISKNQGDKVSKDTILQFCEFLINEIHKTEQKSIDEKIGLLHG